MKFDKLLKLAVFAILPALLFLGGCPGKKAEDAKKEEPKAEVKKEEPAQDSEQEEKASEPAAPVETPEFFSCMVEKHSSCKDYSTGFDIEEAKVLCAAIEGSMFKVGQACPSENRIGTCEEQFDSHKVSYRFYAPAWDLEKAKKECDDDVKLRDDLVGKFVEG